MKTLKFKKESIGFYNANAIINGNKYEWEISNDGNYWGITTYCNGNYLSGDGWIGSRKKMWVDVAISQYNDLLNAKTIN